MPSDRQDFASQLLRPDDLAKMFAVSGDGTPQALGVIAFTRQQLQHVPQLPLVAAAPTGHQQDAMTIGQVVELGVREVRAREHEEA